MNDGWLANRLTHPRFEVEKEYRVLVQGRPDRRILDRLCTGVDLEEGHARAEHAEWLSTVGAASWVRVVLHQGRKRQIRRMLAGFGIRVERLIRVRVGGVRLGALPIGRWRPLSEDEVAMLEAATH
jgi:23S rRNA pseudouridine2605 synthase